MAGDTNHSHGTQPSNERGHPMPRRATPEKSVTLQHHRLAREASRRATPATETSTQQQQSASSPKRGSSGESHETDSGAEKWFDRSNRNPAGNYDGVDMDIDPPFFQKETESSNEGAREPGALLQSANYSYGQGGLQAPPLRPTETHSSSADDFRSVIDDLTIENKRLKEELRRYKQFGPPMMRKEKLFEIKVHGLPKRKKRELEATLRDFAASLEGSSESHSQRRRQDRQGKNLYSSGESRSKHASSSSSHSRRPVDSAYASMSTGPSSHAPNSVVAKSRNGRPLVPTRAQSSADQKTENYPVDTPDGLFPRHVMMTDKDRKKLVVRRLEQLFTGKISGRNMHRNQSMSSLGAPGAVGSSIMGPPQQFEPSREAVIQPLDSGQRKPRSRDNSSTENGDQTESGGNGNGSGRRSGHKTSPPSAPLPEQRPTRPRDLDPDRLQIPSENLDYIRHLGLVPTEFLMDKRSSGVNVSPDADGWVYLNLLCNLAQLHIFNVTPGFIRTAVSEKSTKFQLSPDGQKIRWRGGTDGTKFSSDSSGDNSQKSPSADDTDGSNHRGQRKRVKTNSQSGGAMESKFIPQGSSYSESFHYKPLFVHRTSSAETSLEGTGSQASDEVLDDSNPGNSKWGYSGSGSSQQRRRRIDGAIIYYSGAPFCTDLSGDPGDTSPTTYMTSTARDLSSLDPVPRLEIQRSLSGSSLVIRPLSEAPHAASKALGMYSDIPIDVSSDSDAASEDEDVQFPWSNEGERVGQHRTTATLESCGLGGVVPEDHFAVMVTTRRPITHAKNRLARGTRVMSEDNAEAIANRLAYMRTASPLAPRSTTGAEGPVKIQYLADKLRRFKPWPLPPPAMFIPPFSTDDSESISSLEEAYSEDADNLEDYSASESLMSRRANPHLSVNTAPEHADLPFDDDDGDMDVDMAIDRMSDGDDDMDLSRHPAVPGKLTQTGSSVATAGGAESGYSSSLEDDAL